MNILVTGGAGFIGSHIVDALVGKHEVTIYDNFEPQVHKQEPDYLNKDAELIRADIRDKESMKRAVDADPTFYQATTTLTMGGAYGDSYYGVERSLEKMRKLQ